MTDAYPVRCRTTTSTAGTLNYVLDVAPLLSAHRTPKQAVSDGDLSDGEIVQYLVIDTSVVGNATCELGEGTYNDLTNTISRNASTVWSGSNGPGILYIWPSTGVRDVLIMPAPSAQTARLDRYNIFNAPELRLKDSGVCQITVQTLDSSSSGLGGAFFAGVSADQAWNIRMPGGSDARFIVTDQTNGQTVVNIKPNSGINSLNLSSVGVLLASGISGSQYADTHLHIKDSNANTLPAVEIDQLGSGDAALQFSVVGRSFAAGIDNTDQLFKISHAAVAGTATLGVNDVLSIDGPLNKVSVVNRLHVGGLLNLTLTTRAGVPTLADYPQSGDCGFHFNTLTSDVYVVFNRAGTIYRYPLLS